MKIEKNVILSLLLFTIIMLPLPAAAKESREFAKCMARSDGVTVEMRECDGVEIERMDKRLNRIYQELMRKLPPAEQSKLRAEQRMWLKRYQRSIDKELHATGGTMDLLNADGLSMSFLDKRANELAARLRALSKH